MIKPAQDKKKVMRKIGFFYIPGLITTRLEPRSDIICEGSADLR